MLGFNHFTSSHITHVQNTLHKFLIHGWTRTKFGDRAFSLADSMEQSAWVCQISWDTC